MNKYSIKSHIKEFIIDNFLFGSEGFIIDDKDSFLKRGIIDSTGILELINFIEAKYQITIEDNELLPENLDTLQNVADFILAKRQAL